MTADIGRNSGFPKARPRAGRSGRPVGGLREAHRRETKNAVPIRFQTSQ